MKNAIIVVIIILVIGVGAYLLLSQGGGSYGGNTSQNPTNSETQIQNNTPPAVSGGSNPAAAGGEQQNQSVNIGNFAFSPQSMTIKVGTTVIWTNSDSAAHTIVSDNNPMVLNSDPLKTGEKYSVTFSTPGVYNYHCSVHPNMKGVITVEN